MSTKKVRPSSLPGCTHRIETGCGTLHVTVNHDTDNVAEVFVRLGKAGGCASCVTETIGRLVTIAVRHDHGIFPDIIKQLHGITCHQQRPAIDGGHPVLSCADAVAQILRQYSK